MFGLVRCAIGARVRVAIASSASSAIRATAAPAYALAALRIRSMASDAKESAGGSLSGSVKWFDVRKGYGFIQTSNNQDVFAHYSQVTAPRGNDGMRVLVQGQKVEFEIADGPKGKQAVNIRVTA